MPIPSLTEEQLEQARSAASAARRRRAQIKQQLRDGSLSLANVLDLAETDETVARASVYDVLRSIPRVGERRARELMERHDIAGNRRLRGLGRHQIAGLKAEFS